MVQALNDAATVIWDMQEAEGMDGMPVRLVVEEANRGYPNERMPANLRAMQRLVLQGRHRSIRLTAISQRPALVNTDLRGNADTVIIFRLAGYNDRKTISQMFGPDYIDKIRGLEDREFVTFERGRLVK